MFDDLEKGTVVGGKYRIEGVLGTGGMGSVYQATNASIGRRVAIKLLDAKLARQTDFLHRFQMEAKASAMIGHPNIVDVLDMGEMDDGSPFIVMEYLEGVTLKSLQKKLGSLSPGEVVAVVGPVLDALSAAHAAGVIHRDLKPANIMVGEFGEAMVMDWGVAKELGAAEVARAAGSSSSSPELTRHGAVVGTTSWMAPEQERGEPADRRSDVYSLGALLKLVAGEEPAPSLKAICTRATANEPAGRYPSAEELAKDIRRYLDGQRVLAYPETLMQRVTRVSRPFWPLLGVLGFYLALRLAVFLGWGN